MIDKLCNIILSSGLLMVYACSSAISMIESPEVYGTKDFGFAQAVIHGGLIYGSGQVGWNKEFELAESFEQQLAQTTTNIELILKEVAADWGDVIHLRIYVVDLNDAHRATVGRFLNRTFSSEYVPATTLLGVDRLAQSDLKIEIEFIAKAYKS